MTPLKISFLKKQWCNEGCLYSLHTTESEAPRSVVQKKTDL